MSELKHIIVDILVTVLIVLAVGTQWRWTWWIVVVYTPLMIVLKLIALLGTTTLPKLKANVPTHLVHILYGINVLALALAGWWALCGGWVVIWLLSYLQDRRSL